MPTVTGPAAHRLFSADLHVHTHASHDSLMRPERIVATALARGLDVLGICDHNTITGGLAVKRAAQGTPLTVIVGSELRTTEGEIIGLFLAEEIERGLTPEQTVAAIKAQGGVVVVPHPFDRYRSSPLATAALERIAADIDAIEALNARNLDSADDEKARAWAEARRVPHVAGSDSHTYSEIGRVRTLLPPFENARDFVRALAEARTQGKRSSPLVHVPTAVVKRLRRKPAS